MRATLAAAAAAVIAAIPGAGVTLAAPFSASTLPVRQINPPVIIPSPAPVDGGSGARTPSQPDLTDTWRIADTGGVPARVRSAPSLEASVVMRLDPGTVVEPLNDTASADGYQWRRISVAGSVGWIATSLLLEPAPPPRGFVYVVAAVGERGLNVREAPSTTAPIVGSLREGDVVELVTGPREGEGRQWLQVRNGDIAGWVIAEAIGQR